MEFQDALALKSDEIAPTANNEKLRHQAHIDILTSQIEEFQEEIAEYDLYQNS